MIITDNNRLKDFHSKNRVWQGTAVIERTKSGRLFISFCSGSFGEALGTYCTLIKSDDDGATWSELIAVTYAGEMHCCYDPMLWIDPLGRLWFTWTYGHEDDVYATICENPDADELVWSKEFCIGRGHLMNKPIVLSTGEWLFPMAVWSYKIITDQVEFERPHIELCSDKFNSNKELSGANVYKTNDNGKTFKLIGGCKNIYKRECDEHLIYEKKNGVLVMLIRTLDGIARSFSYDRGETWTDAFSFLPNPSARFHVKRLKSGRLLLVNHHNFSGRSHITALLSDDDGETWNHSLLIDERSNVSYPDAVEGEDGYIYITYDRERGVNKKSLEEAESFAREILFAKVNEEDIINGKIVADGSFLKHIVSKLGKYEGEKNLYPKFPEIGTDDFVNTVCEYTDKNKILENLYVFYWLDFLNMKYESVLKIDAVIEEILKCEEKKNLRDLLYKAVQILLKSERKADNGKKQKLLNGMLDIISAAPEKADLDAFAKENSVSKKYLLFVFEKRIGFTVDEYLKICAFTKAKECLVNSDYEVSFIAQKFEFKESDFIKRFIKKEGITPEEYRKYNKKKA